MTRQRQRLQPGPRQLCPLCHEGFEEDDVGRLAQCPGCQTIYHRACAREMGGCGTLGCERRGKPPLGAVSERVLRSRDDLTGPRRKLRKAMGIACLLVAFHPWLWLLVTVGDPGLFMCWLLVVFPMVGLTGLYLLLDRLGWGESTPP